MPAPAPVDYLDDVILAERFGGWSELDALPLWRKLRLYEFLELEANA